MGYVLVRRLGYPLNEVEKYLHCDPATVHSLISRLAERMGNDDAMRRKVRVDKDSRELKV